MTSIHTETSSPQPERQGVGRLVVYGMIVGAVALPILIYFGADLFGQFGPACRAAGSNQDMISCSARQYIMAGMGVPVGAIVGFVGAYWVALRRWK
jgi:ABC-type uncharacterized transport system permease subunit